MFKKKEPKVAVEKVYTYAPTGKLAKILKYLLTASIVLSVLSIAANLWGISFINQISSGASITQEQGDIIDGFAALVAIIALVVHIVTGICFLRWFYLLRRNMSAMKVQFFEGHPLDVVGAFIIPIVNLYQPLVHAQDIWRATDSNFPSDRHWAGAPSSPVIKFWWFFFVCQNIAHQVSGFYASISMKKNVRLVELLNVYTYSAIAEVLSIVAAVLAIKVVVAMTERQEKFHSLRFEHTGQTSTEQQSVLEPKADAS
ncbi:MAG: DUF4328 domain-containing protein [Candidatus Obscuribacterales bacterium]|nr:DUF4328 domain-containing protein [Candidatus Obscuribacterales bacterium]